VLKTSLYIRLSGFYLVYFATLGVILPYWSLYLRSLNFEPARIGELIAVLQATKVVAPNVWGWIADHTGKRMTIIRIACLATTACFAGLYFVGDSFFGMALVTLSFSFFWNAALPQFEATTLDYLGHQDIHIYSRIRLWGSVGFILTALLGGFVLQDYGVDIVPMVLLGLFLTLWLNSLSVPEKVTATLHPRQPQSLGQVLLQSRVLTLLTVCFLIQASHGPYYAFFSIYLESLGYSQGLIGGLWGLGVVAEVIVFMLMPKMLPRFGARQLILVTLGLTSLRWVLIGVFASHLSLLLLAQILHAFSFGVYHVVAIHLIHQFFTGPHQGRGQALYSSVGFGAGGALGSLAAGYEWTLFGPNATYLLAAGLSMLGLLVGRELRC
jgi:PPP family 3-phenylpropionic acid transporter